MPDPKDIFKILKTGCFDIIYEEYTTQASKYGIYLLYAKYMEIIGMVLGVVLAFFCFLVFRDTDRLRKRRKL